MKKILICIIVIFVCFGFFLIPGFVDYFEYKNAAEAVSGFAWQCGASKVASVMTGCAIVEGKCTCPMCDSSCVGYSEIDFTGQSVCKGATYACVSQSVIMKGGAKNITECAGKQAIFGGTNNTSMNANDIVACPGTVAGTIVKMTDKFNNIIAGFKSN